MENFREKRLERQLRTQQTTSIVIGVILLLSITGNVYLFLRNSNITNENEELTIEKTKLITDLQSAEASNAELYAEIDILNEQIEGIREHAADLESEIQIRDSRIAVLRNQMTEIEDLRKQLAELKELEELEEDYRKLEEERHELLEESQTLGQQLSHLKGQQESLLDKIENATYLKAYNVCVNHLRDRWLWFRPVVMDVARRVDRTTVSFEINSNIFVEPAQKHIYLVMHDSDGNVVNPSAETFTVAENGTSSHYTEYTNIQYEGRAVPLNFTITHEESLESGTYNITVYIDGLNSGSKEFKLE